MNVFIIGGIIGVVVVVAAFIWLNRNKPDIVDKGEQEIRDFKKP